jgi:hypothetical protein
VKRRLLNLLTALSLLLCVAVVALWVRSYFATDTVRVVARQGVTRVVLFWGDAVVASRPEENGYAFGSFTFGTDDQPRAPDYSWRNAAAGGSGTPTLAPPASEYWTPVPFESFRTVPLSLVAAAGATPLVLLLVVRRLTRPPAGPSGAVTVLARAATTASTLVLLLGVAGWADCERWNTRAVEWDVGGFAYLYSYAGTGAMTVSAVWEPLDRVRHWPNVPPDNTLTDRPGVAWHGTWVSPEQRARGGGYPTERCWFAWFKGKLYYEEPPRGRAGASDPERRPAVVGFDVSIPYWLIVGTAAALPAASIARYRRRRRRNTAGLCPSCGYDLRATPGRCPECGTMAAATAAP